MFIPKLFGSPGSDAHQQVGTPEQNMEPVHVLGNATVCNFPIPGIPLDYEKGVLYRRFVVERQQAAGWKV